MSSRKLSESRNLGGFPLTVDICCPNPVFSVLPNNSFYNYPYFVFERALVSAFSTCSLHKTQLLLHKNSVSTRESPTEAGLVFATALVSAFSACTLHKTQLLVHKNYVSTAESPPDSVLPLSQRIPDCWPGERPKSVIS